MLLEEARALLKTSNITEEQLWQLSPIYCLLDFDKTDFCKLVDAIGLDKWLKKSARWNRLDKAEQEFAAKERYLDAKARLLELESEKEHLEQIVSRYKAV
ncbi:MAG: hypothetical protein LBS21_13175 [Clostridiales bacterium]|jgi:hypothetical protein|nr:hypothetical protein [Clostridiales bacterium]